MKGMEKMMIEQEMVVIKAKDLEDYKAKHGSKDNLPEAHFFSATVPEDAFYKEKTKALEKEIAKLREENRNLKTVLEELRTTNRYLKELHESCRSKNEDRYESRVKEYQERIQKLEHALAEATIR